MVLVGLMLALPAAAAASGLSHDDAGVLRELNRVRIQHGLRPLRPETHLQRAAHAHSREMLAANVFGHGAFGSRMLQFDVTGSAIGENIAWGAGARGTARGIVAAWLASPMHRANLLRPSFTRAGVADIAGSFLGTRGAHVVTADFAG